jgi:hypothetical protein
MQIEAIRKQDYRKDGKHAKEKIISRKHKKR